MPNDHAAVTHVASDETVYRSVKDDPLYFQLDGDGRLRLSGNAFNDPNKQPSVDRAAMNSHDPCKTCKSESDGIVSLIASEVRAIKANSFSSNGVVTSTHDVDVVHVPLVENAAHAEVHTDPNIFTGSTFKRLKEALSLLAQRQGWTLKPASQRIPLPGSKDAA